MTETIRLGGCDFTLRPPTLGQLRHLLDALDAMTGASGGALIDAAARLVAAGLAAAHAELTVEAVLDLDASLAELNTAVAAILRQAGLSPREFAPGEADPRVTPGEMASSATIAEPIPAPGSAASMAPSPPAAATATASSPT
jgi:hypothetical protein